MQCGWGTTPISCLLIMISSAAPYLLLLLVVAVGAYFKFIRSGGPKRKPVSKADLMAASASLNTASPSSSRETKSAFSSPRPPASPAASSSSSSSSFNSGTAAARTSASASASASASNLPAHPTFPQLRVRELMSPGQPEMPPNTRGPVAFKNDVFEGRVQIMLKCEPEDPHFADHFAGKRRTMEVQIQGRFLEKPRGTLYIGGEIPDKMNIGVMMRTLAGMMLRMVKSLAHGKFHHSFGSESKDEIPHIVTSMYCGVDRFMVTPPGETPPALGREFPETDADRKVRRSSSNELDIDTSSTYSLSYNSMYIDLLGWRVVKIPGFKPIDLHNYWDDQPLIVPLYDLVGDGKFHSGNNKRYFFRLEFQHQPHEVAPVPSFPVSEDDEKGDDDDDDDDDEGDTLARLPASRAGPRGSIGDGQLSKASYLIRTRRESIQSAAKRNANIDAGKIVAGGVGAPGAGAARHLRRLFVEVPSFIEYASSCKRSAVFILRLRSLPGVSGVGAASSSSVAQTSSSASSSKAKGGGEVEGLCVACDAQDLSHLAQFVSGELKNELLRVAKKIKNKAMKSGNVPYLEAKRRLLDSIMVQVSTDPSQARPLVDVLAAGWGRHEGHLLSRELATKRYKYASKPLIRFSVPIR